MKEEQEGQGCLGWFSGVFKRTPKKRELYIHKSDDKIPGRKKSDSFNSLRASRKNNKKISLFEPCDLEVFPKPESSSESDDESNNTQTFEPTPRT